MQVKICPHFSSQISGQVFENVLKSVTQPYSTEHCSPDLKSLFCCVYTLHIKDLQAPVLSTVHGP